MFCHSCDLDRKFMFGPRTVV